MISYDTFWARNINKPGYDQMVVDAEWTDMLEDPEVDKEDCRCVDRASVQNTTVQIHMQRKAYMGKYAIYPRRICFDC